MQFSIKNTLWLAGCYHCGKESAAMRVSLLLKTGSMKLQNGENHLPTYTNHFCSSSTKALIPAPGNKPHFYID